MPRSAIAGTRDPRLLTVILRGGLDGIAMVAPVGDPDYARLRGNLAIPASGQGAGLPLDSFFALNPQHAVPARPLPEARGAGRARRCDALSRPLAFRRPGRAGKRAAGRRAHRRRLAQPRAGGLPVAGAAAPKKGLAMGAVVPLVMRGAAPVLSWIPKAYNLPLRESTIARLMDLYSVTDPKLAKAFADGLEIDRIGGGRSGCGMTPPPRRHQRYPPRSPRHRQQAATPARVATGPPRPFRDFVEAAEAAARFLAAAGWPAHRRAQLQRLGHARQRGRHPGPARQPARRARRGHHARCTTGLGAAWKDTVVADRHRVRPHRPRQRHRGHRPRHRHGAHAGRRRGEGRPHHRRLAGPRGDSAATRTATSSRRAICAPCCKGVLRDHLGIPDGALAQTGVPRQRRAPSRSTD